MAVEKACEQQVDLSPDSLALSSWGLPEAILAQYESCGVKSIFPWQAECLLMGDVLNGENLVFSAPTSAGKSLIAEILMLKRVLENRKKALLIVPFISMAKEKVGHLQDLYRNVDLRVGGFMGNTSAPGGFKATDVLICTIEKANSMINRLMEAGRLSEIGIIVVDEIHLLGDASRGYLLELLLTKVLYNCYQVSNELSTSKTFCEAESSSSRPLTSPANVSSPSRVQIVGMSATLPNLDVVAEWLRARLYRTDFRPVPLTQMMKVGPVIYDSHLSAIRTLPGGVGLNEDGDNAVQLTLETIITGHSVLIFCPSRDWCENLAQKIAKDIMAVGSARESALAGYNLLKAARQGLRTHLDGVQLESLIEELRDSTAGLDSVLRKTISSGVAFHHAGLTVEERDVVESGFRRGILKVLVATSTLSSGVNLPARRVLVRSPYAGGTRLLDSLVYHQMIGRAGRTGVDTVGESILMCKESERNAGCELMTDGLRPIDSCLKREGERLSSALKRAILEIVVNGVASCVENVKTYVGCTLLAALAKSNQESGIEKCMQELLDAELIRIEKDPDHNGSKYVPTALGKAVVSAALPPDEGISLYGELDRARRGLLLENDLHLLYQVTPLSAVSQVQRMDWFLYRTIWHGLPESMRRVGDAVGVDDGFLFRCLKGLFRNNERSDELTVHARFYSALALNDLANEVSLKDVADKYGFNRGYLQSLQQSAATYAGMVAVFCEKLGWKNLELLISQFQSRLNFGVTRELCDLMQVSSLDSKVARALFDSGIETCADLAATHPAVVEKLLVTTGPFSKGKTVWRQGMGYISVSRAAALVVQEGKAVVERHLGRHVNIRWASQAAAEGSIQQEAPERLVQQNHPERTAEETSTTEVDQHEQRAVLPDIAPKSQEEIVTSDLAEDSLLSSQELFDDSRPASPVVPEQEPVDEKIVQVPSEDPKGMQAETDQPAGEERRSVRARQSMDPSEFDEDLFEDEVTWPSMTALQLMEDEKAKETRRSVDQQGEQQDSSLDDTKTTALNQAIQECCEDPSRRSLSQKMEETLDWEGSVSDTLLNQMVNAAENPPVVRANQPPSWDTLNSTVSESMIQFMMETEVDPRAVEDSQPDTLPSLRAPGAVETSDTCMALDGSQFSDSMLQQLVQFDGQGSVKVEQVELIPADSHQMGTSGNEDNKDTFLKPASVRINRDGKTADASLAVGNSQLSDSLFQEIVQSGEDELVKVQQGPAQSNGFAVPAEVVRKQTAMESMDMDMMGGSFSNSMIQLISNLDPSTGTSKEVPPQMAENALGSFDVTMPTMTDSMMMELCAAEEATCGGEALQDATNIPAPSVGVSTRKPRIDSPGEMPSVSASMLEEMMAMDCGEAHLAAISKPIETPPSYHLRPRRSRRSTSGRKKALPSAEKLSESGNNSNSSVSTPVFARIVTEHRKRSSGRSSGSTDVVGPSPEVVGTSAEKGRNKSKLMHHRRKHGKRKHQPGRGSPSTSNASKISKCESTVEESHFQDQSTTTSVFPVPIDTSANETSEDLQKLVDAWKRSATFSLSLACIDVEVETKSVAASKRIGSKFQPKGVTGATQQGFDESKTESDRFLAVVSGGSRQRKLTGVAVCLEGSVAHFLSFHDTADQKKDGPSLDEKLLAIRSSLLHEPSGGKRKENTVVIFEARSQLRVLWKVICQRSLEDFPGKGCQVVDPKVAAWYIDAGIGEPCFEDLIGKLSGSHQEILTSLVAHDGVGSPGLTAKSKIPEDAKKNACLEAVLAFKLWEFLQGRLKSVEGHRGFFSIESPCLVAMTKMESHGFGFDTRRCLELRKALERKRESLLKLAHKSAGRVFNLSSRRKLTEVLTEVLGNVKASGQDKPCLTITADSLDKEVLQAAAKYHPLPEYVLKWRKIGMALTQFVIPFSGGDLIGRHWNAGKNTASSSLDDSGRVHADWEYFTATGRLATRDPNLQTIFKDFEAAGDKFSLRSMFVPKMANGEGILIAGDYSQMDLRILAHLANDSALLSHLNSDCDVLRVVAGAHLRKDPHKVTDEERQSTKQVVYGIVYGIGAASLARQLDITESEAEKLMITFLDRYPGIKRYIRSQIERVRSTGFVETLSGRRRQLPGINSESVAERGHAERQAVHTAVQGSAADLLKAAMVVAEDELRKKFVGFLELPRLVMSLHDELIFEAPKILGVDRLAECLKKSMECAWCSCTGVELRVKTPVKISVGESWGSLIPWMASS